MTDRGERIVKILIYNYGEGYEPVILFVRTKAVLSRDGDKTLYY
ncbi:hypothetical protein [Oceanobacillus neutriphilus]|nr:hypothetical protein [Oceanobacillus neutriphilus]